MVKLQAGANVPLTKENPHLDRLVVGFGWRVIQPRGPQIELVPAAILTDGQDQAISEDHFVFFNQLASPEGSVAYVDSGDQEQVELTLSQVPDTVQKIFFIVYVNPDIRVPGSFQAVKSAYVRVADDKGLELLRFELPTDLGSEVTAMIFGSVYRHSGEWKFRAIGQGYSTGIEGVAKDFGVTV